VTPKEHYQQSLSKKGFCGDAGQAQAVEHTQALYERLLKHGQAERGLFDKLLNRPDQPVTGLYLWGGVGRGKTFLIDAFYECIPFAYKKRMHFHRFMQGVHEELRKLPKSPDPLVVIAKSLAMEVRLICLDEFLVNDIADAMLLSGLLKALFENGVCLVTTSNTPPDDLYKNGLQRERFLPVIDLIKQYTEVIELSAGADYRLDLIEKSGAYHFIDEGFDNRVMDRQFKELSPEQASLDAAIRVNHHNITIVARSDDVVWFNFFDLCETARSSMDYVEISRIYHTVLVDHVPVMDEGRNDVAKRFIDLVDALYDHNVKLIVSAEAEPGQLYSGRQLAFAFERTASRLMEMRSHRYLSRPHKP
jgi:cell division protein ZapE